MHTNEDMRRGLAAIDEVIACGRFKDDWRSLCQYRTPQWFEDAKFGVFIHWGAYAVPAYGSESYGSDWYAHNMYVQGTPEYEHHVATYGPQREFGYKDFIPMFTAERFDPEAWADVIKGSGARYAVPVAEHHDGFQMYRSRISHWNSYEMGPKRDVLGELTDAFRRRGLVGGASSHRVEHWFFMGHGREFDSDIREPLERGDLYWPSVRQEPEHYDLDGKPEPTREFLEDWLLRTCEIVDAYHPRIMYFDWWILHRAVQPYLRKFAAYYYNRADDWGEGVVICYKHDAFMFGTAVPDVERGVFAECKPFHWQTDMSVAFNSWGYTDANVYRPAADVLRYLVDIVSKNGNLLLNIGPKADGTIAEGDRKVLAEVGRWLETNGEAIYGCRPWRRFGEGPTPVREGQFTDGDRRDFSSADIRYTVNGSALYAIAMRGAEDGVYRFRLLHEGNAEQDADFQGIIAGVSVLGRGRVDWTRNRECLEARVPGPVPDEPVVFRIDVG